MSGHWMEISSDERHTTYAMPVVGGALIRHTEHEDGGTVAVSVCFVPSQSGGPLTASEFHATVEPVEQQSRSAFFIERAGS